MSEKAVVEEVLKRVDALAQKLGVTAEYLWPKLVAYQWAKAWMFTAWFLPIAVALVFLLVYNRKYEEAKKYNLEIARDRYDTSRIDTDTWSNICVAMVIVIGLSVVGLFLHFIHEFPALVSPEARAFFHLLGGGGC